MRCFLKACRIRRWPTARSAVTGNLLQPSPGVIDGVDMQYAGSVRKIDAEGIKAQLRLGNIVILSPLGASPTGETSSIWRWRSREATAVAISADKLIFLTDSQ